MDAFIAASKGSRGACCVRRKLYRRLEGSCQCKVFVCIRNKAEPSHMSRSTRTCSPRLPQSQPKDVPSFGAIWIRFWKRTRNCLENYTTQFHTPSTTKGMRGKHFHLRDRVIQDFIAWTFYKADERSCQQGGSATHSTPASLLSARQLHSWPIHKLQPESQ